MSIQGYKVFNMEEHRPQVLLLGNGLTYETGIPWYELIERVARTSVSVAKYEKPRVDHDRFAGYEVPNTVLTLATSETDDTKRHKTYGDVFKKITYNSNDLIDKLMKLPFDAILSTNYTYELESSLHKGYPDLTPESKRKYAFQTEKDRDPKYLLRTFNRIKGKDIWHIHGELRRPSSLILSHDEYARLTHKILEYNASRGRDYEKDQKELKFKSWVDYFLMGDVYVLGLTMDYSDFDLWWLLGRRLREHAECGKFIFYEPEKEDNKHKQMALKDSGAEVRTCGITINPGVKYTDFYEAAIEDIQSEV